MHLQYNREYARIECQMAMRIPGQLGLTEAAAAQEVVVTSSEALLKLAKFLADNWSARNHHTRKARLLSQGRYAPIARRRRPARPPPMSGPTTGTPA
jgi:hypothetical protein